MKGCLLLHLFVIVAVFKGGVSQRPISATTDQMHLRIKPLSDISKLPYRIGHLEFFQDGNWFRVCSENWGDDESSVACGNLGFSDFAPLTPAIEAYRAFWDAQIRLKDVQCDGTESTLSQCSNVSVTFNRLCYSGRAVILNCKTKAANGIRLRGGALVGEGRVQVAFNGNWGGICGNQWNIRSGNVACRQLGYGTAKQTYQDAEFGQGHTVVWFTNVTCNGKEKRLSDCPKVHPEVENFLNYTSPGCSIRQQASVVCRTPNTGTQDMIELLDGQDGTVGRVVVKVGDSWGSICSDNWRINEAMVVCRQLGLGYASRALQNVQQMTTSGRRLDIVTTSVWCMGTESSLSECRQRTPLRSGSYIYCGSKWSNGAKYVGAVCSRSGLPDLQLDIPELQDSISIDVQPLWNLQCAAEENCLSKSAQNVTDQNSLRSLLRLTVNVWNRGTADFLPWQNPTQWEWHECHNHYHSMAEFAHYDILSLQTFNRVAEGHKVSFCLSDTMCINEKGPAYHCNETPDRSEQGISVGCSDAYYSWFDCQWIDITDVPPGEYILRVSLNPQHLVAELDVFNNDITCELTYDGEKVVVRPCHISDDVV